MLRSCSLALLLVLVPGCAAVEGDSVLALEETEAAAELDCMTRCLSESDGTCDDCADHCMDHDAYAPPVEITAIQPRRSSAR